MSIELKAERCITIGVVADTHIPDRVNGLHPQLIPELKRREVDFILHCGDLSRRQVLDDLKTVAPVYAARGNRDIFLRKELPISQILLVNGIRFFLTHGHLTPLIYWADKVENFFHGYDLKRYVKRMEKADPEARIYVFGHTHRSENSWVEGHLYFNPGGSSVGSKPDFGVSYGIIRIHTNGEIESEITQLNGAVVKFKKWDIEGLSRSENC